MTKKQGVTGPGGVELVKHGQAFEFRKAKQIWIAGPKGGKTSTAAALGEVAEENGMEDEVNPFLMLHEDGSRGVELHCTSEKCPCAGKNKSCPECNGTGVKRKVLRDLVEMKEWYEWAAQSEFNPIVIDTGNAFFQAISDGVCKEMGYRLPTDGAHGNVWFGIADTLREFCGVLEAADKGVIFLMHVYETERTVKGGGTVIHRTFHVSGQSKGYLAGFADQILFFDTTFDDEGEDKRIISIDACAAGIEAGDRWGVFPPELDRGDSPQEAAKAILGCYYDLDG